jgi:hypothetical protein
MQNGAKPGDIAEMLDLESFTQIKKNLKKADRAQQQLEQAQQEAQQEQAQQQMQMQQQLKEMENIENEKDRQKDIEIALIGAEAKKEASTCSKKN